MSQSIDISGFTTVVIPVTKHNLPTELFHEADGACWRAGPDDEEECGWRWFPMNWTAFAKGEPTGEMTEFVMPACTCPQIIGRDVTVLDVTRDPCPLHPSIFP